MPASSPVDDFISPKKARVTFNQEIPKKNFSSERPRSVTLTVFSLFNPKKFRRFSMDHHFERPATVPEIHEPEEVIREEPDPNIFEFITTEEGVTYYFNPKDPIGGGGTAFGNVFLGSNLNNPDELVAIKRLHLHGNEREAQMREHGFFGHKADDEENALRKVNMLKGKCKDAEGRTILVMEYVPGFSPKELINAGYLLDEDSLKRLAKKTQKAVKNQIHKRGLTHNDIHQGNIRVDLVPKESLKDKVLRKFHLSSSDDRNLSITRTQGFTNDLDRYNTLHRYSTAETTTMPVPGHEGKWSFKPRFIDYGLARDFKGYSEKEFKDAKERDEERAYNAVWLQRHKLPKTSLDMERRAVTTGGLSFSNEKPRKSFWKGLFHRDRNDGRRGTIHH